MTRIKDPDFIVHRVRAPRDGALAQLRAALEAEVAELRRIEKKIERGVELTEAEADRFLEYQKRRQAT